MDVRRTLFLRSPSPGPGRLLSDLRDAGSYAYMGIIVYVAVAVYVCNCNWIDMGVDVDADRRYGVGVVTHWAAHA